MHVVWHFLAYIFESLLFLLTGGFLGYFFIGRDADGLVLSLLSKDVIWKLFVFQILLFLLRGVSLAAFWKILNWSGKKQSNFKDIFVMTYAGLRGAIGLSLAMIVKHSALPASKINEPESFKYFQVITILFVCFTIVFTVLV